MDPKLISLLAVRTEAIIGLGYKDYISIASEAVLRDKKTEKAIHSIWNRVVKEVIKIEKNKPLSTQQLIQLKANALCMLSKNGRIVNLVGRILNWVTSNRLSGRS